MSAASLHDYSKLSDDALRQAELMLKLQFNWTYGKFNSKPALEPANTPDYYAQLRAICDEKKRRVK